jgi:ribonucleotide reductase alpha subunit
MELIFDQNNPDFTAKNLYDAIHHAHTSGIKAIYYIRSIKKNEKLEIQEEACVGCAG